MAITYEIRVKLAHPVVQTGEELISDRSDPNRIYKIFIGLKHSAELLHQFQITANNRETG
jgi:hypothetical protein